MLSQQGDNAPAHVAACARCLHPGGGHRWSRHRGTAGCFKQALVLLLHLLQHAQQERFTLLCGMLPLQGSLFPGVCGLKLSTQQVPLQAQQVPLLLEKRYSL
jgi:hypothetical protein